MPAIPERQPIADHFDGVVTRLSTRQVLARSSPPAGDIIASGDLVIRYGVAFLGKPHLAIVPGLIALDYGDMLTGEEAWAFLLHRSNLHPRADVLGYRNDGLDDMVVVKALDLVQPIHVLVYTDEAATKPVARPTALIAADSDGIAPRVIDYLPQYPTIEAFQVARHD